MKDHKLYCKENNINPKMYIDFTAYLSSVSVKTNIIQRPRTKKS